jgi:signal transduction histidine kinase/CheY-like chemotaxis protein
MLITASAGLFLLVFGRALVAFIRSRDRLQGAVTVVFTAVAALFFLQVSRYLFGEPPRWLRDGSVILLFGQPFFTVVLVALIRRITVTALVLTAAGWIASAVAFVVLPAPMPKLALSGVCGYFVLGEIVAGAYLAAEARRRTGAPRARMLAAAGGTMLFAVAMLGLAGGSLIGTPAVTSVGARIIALGSAFAYLMAFLPPRWLRRLWSAQTAYTLMSRLLGGSAGAKPRQTWQSYAEAVLDAVDADVAVVVSCGADGDVRPIASARRDDDSPQVGTEELRRLVATPTAHGGRRGAPGRAAWARRGRGGYVASTLPLALHAGGAGALVMMGRHRSLFSEDDVTLLTELGRQATALADRNLATARLRGLVDELRAANHAKSDFVAAMSHELRTPLNAIIGFSELMGEEETVDDRRLVPDEWIDNIHSSGRHLLGLINDVLDLAKVEAGRIELRLEGLEAGAAVAEAVVPLRPLIDAKGLRFTVAVPPVMICADRLRLRQMLNNLLSNAIKFTPEGGSIYITGHRVGSEAHLSVADTGPGIDHADQRRVFEEFHQTGSVDSRAAGTGLGLALTRRLAEAHNGRVELHSQPGHGSRFTLILPAAEAGPVEKVRTGPDNRPEARGGVLLIEDDPAATGLLRTYLAGAGYEVTEAGTGEEGLATARRCAPDVILLDVLLPGMDGWTVLQELKSDERLRHIPVLMVTVVDEREVGLALGAVDYFVKPVDRTTLLAWLTRHGLVPNLTAARPRVLVVDSDPTTQTAVQRCLHAEGLDAVIAASGADALDLARSGPFDLVMCDLTLPDVDGFTFVTALHDDPRTGGLPVLVFTAVDLSEADKARLGGKIVGVLAKNDFDPTDLRTWLARAIRPLARAGGEPSDARETVLT